MLHCVGDRRRSRVKIPRIQVFAAQAKATGAKPFSRIRSWSRNRRDIKLEARAGMPFWGRSQSRSKLPRLRIPDSGLAVPSLRLSVLFATRRPPGCPTTPWPIGALWGCSQSVRHGERTRTIGGSLNGSQVAYRAYEHSGCRVHGRRPCNHLKNCHYMKSDEYPG